MKTSLLLASIAFSMNALAQPVIQNGNTKPEVGTTAPLYAATAPAGAGNAGANVVWDFSNVAFTAPGMTWTVVDPAATPFFSTYPSANYGWTLTSTGPTRYFYFNVSSTKWEVLADNLAQPGTGNDFSPNPLTALQFPISYGNSFTDSYQKVGGSASTTTVTYDAYGTLITPFATYTNVWRVKEVRGTNPPLYTWENQNPMQPILIFNEANNSFTLFGDKNTTGITEESTLSFKLYPNPVANELTIQTKDKLQLVEIYNLNGALQLASEKSNINTAGLSQGVYLIKVLTASGVATQKFIKE